MPKTAPTNWDNEAHLALLQALVLKAPPSAAQWDDVLEEVGKKGYIYTSSAAVPAADRMAWDHEADRQLLICLAEASFPSSTQISEVVTLMQRHFGRNITPKAVSQHLQKLRRKEVGGGGGSNGEGSSTPKAPGGKKKATTPAKTASTGKKRKTGKQPDLVSSILSNSGDDEDDDDYDTPSKKKIKQAISRNNAVKQEAVELQDEEDSFEPQPFVKEEARDLEWENRDMV
ncbi:hypothetical protein B0T18DRAFT_491254 [Schizothecium vesticola]|uniref:Uncharacterized protein n=1 Tax=Schizothecium vesticola TaxID=314040 RepID=A0AA40EK27_9PEZI|nr:hypothetical protein B0T18DRAFT_491254 [Schizothecium vesticola]